MAKIKNAVEETTSKQEPAKTTETLATKLTAIVGVDLNDEQVANIKALFAKGPSKKIHKQWKFVSKAFAAKTPTQMQQAVLCIEGLDQVDMKVWAEKLASWDGFKTNQTVDRIIAFYKTRMINEGLIAVVE